MKNLCRDCLGAGAVLSPCGENQGCLNCAGWGTFTPSRLQPPKQVMKDPQFVTEHDDLGSPLHLVMFSVV